MKNGSTLRQASPALAAEFLQEFAGDGPWAHVDMAGPGFLERSRGDYLTRPGRHRLGRPADRRAGQDARVNYDLTDEQELIRRTVREFAETTRGARWRRSSTASRASPTSSWASSPSSGLMGLPIPEEYGGAGGDTVSYAIAVEELTRVDSSVAITVAAHTSLGTMPILLFGSEEQKREWLPRLASGQGLGAFGLTEPDAGSDAGATRTRAELRDGEWVIDGSKIFITNAGTDISACVTITARTGDGEVSNLIVPNGTPGYEISPPLHKLGWHASDTRELSFRECRVPEGNLLGERGSGLPPVHGDPRRRPHLGRGDGRRPRAGRLRPRVRLRAGAAAVRQADRASSRRCGSSSPTWRPRSRRAASSSTAPRG